MDSEYLLQHERLLSDTILGFVSVSDVFALLQVSQAYKQSLKGRCDTIQICILPAGEKKTHASTIVDAYYSTQLDNVCWNQSYAGLPHSFLNQAWSAVALKAKVAVNRATWQHCCNELLTASSEVLYREIRTAIRGLSWLIQNIHIERILGLNVPKDACEQMCVALGLLPQPLTLGQGPYEEKYFECDWMGTALSWIPGICRHEGAGVEGLSANRAVSWAEEVDGFDFGEFYPDKELLNRQMYKFLPKIDGLFVWNLQVPSLLAFSSESVHTLERLGCLWFQSSRDIPQRSTWKHFPKFDQVKHLSVKFWDFFCGAQGWPVGQECRLAGACQAQYAKVLAQFLGHVFPNLRVVDLFFRFTSQDAPKPSGSLTCMMRTLLQELQKDVGHPCETSVSVEWLWETDFDNLDNIDVVCSQANRRRDLVISYGRDILEVDDVLSHVCVDSFEV